MGSGLMSWGIHAILGGVSKGRSPVGKEKVVLCSNSFERQAVYQSNDVKLPPAKGRKVLANTCFHLRWMAGLLALSLAFLLSACAAEEGTETLEPGETSATAEASPAAQATPEEAESAASPATPAMTVEEIAPDARITDIRFGQHPDFERLVIDFTAVNGSAGAVPHWRMEKAPGEGVLRIHLPTVTETAFTDALLADTFDWFTHVYVVRASDGSLFVDVFVPAEYQVRLQELRGPLRLAIDIAPGGEGTHTLPATARNSVLITPRPGATIQGTLTVSGYSRNFEANNVIILQDSEGNELVRSVANSTDYIETWGSFSATIAVPNRTGAGKLLVGDFDARNGKFEGVTIPVQFGGS